MSVLTWTYIMVGVTFALYIGIAIWSKAKDTSDFYVAHGQVSPLANGLATAADWMSAASFLGMAGAISFMGRDGSVYLMGWTGGYVLLALLLAPYLKKFGKFTVPDFVGERYYSRLAREIAVLCAIFISFTYVAGQMRGVGVVFSRFLEVPIDLGVIIGMGIVFFYAVLGGMKGITYTQVAQYCVLIFAFLVPAIFISLMLSDSFIPQIGFGSILDKLDGLQQELGFTAYTAGTKSTVDVFAITLALMVGTAGLPHVIIRFFTVPNPADARKSAGYALFFIAILYTTAPAVSAFAKYNLLNEVSQKEYISTPNWFKKWEDAGLIAWTDKNGDGVIQYFAGSAFGGTPEFIEGRGSFGERLTRPSITNNANELYVDKDIMVLANPEIANLPAWIIALVAAGGLAAALSTAAGLLLVISSAVSHDLVKSSYRPEMSEKEELRWARGAAGVAVVVAGYFGINPPDFVASVVAFAFGLAASSFFPVIFMGIFTKWMNKEGAIAGMLSGLIFTTSYIVYFKFISPEYNSESFWWFGISPEGIGSIGMLVNFAVSIIVAKSTKMPPKEVQELVEDIRVPI
ncbi:MAG: cation acetate symporter [Halobacteriovoraceae bacterium]|nr:cation acetate symporter [Halobacteriovoraceae bacterium]